MKIKSNSKMENSKICRLCLCNNGESINLFSEMGKALKIALIVSQHFWFEPIEDDNYSNLICSICWDHLSKFHEFFKSIELAQETLLNSTAEVDLLNKNELKDCDASIVKLEKDSTLLKYEINIDDDFIRDEAEIENEALDKCETSSNRSIDFSSDRSSSDSEYTIVKKQKRKTNSKTEKSNTNTGPSVAKRRGRPPKNRDNLQEKKIKTEVDKERALVAAGEKLDRKLRRDEEDKKIRDFFELTCKMCEFRSITFVAVKLHYRQVHSIKRGFVSCCDKKFFRRGRILEHIAWHGNPNTFRCPICNKSYQDTHALKIHMPNHASEDERIYKCDLCNKTFAKKYNLSQHIRITHVPDHLKIHKCPTCGKAFGARSILHSHIRGVHDFAYVSVCDICAKVFKSKAQCALHRQQEHSDQKKLRVQCTICETWHKNENGLSKHIRRSHHQQPQSCEICGKVSPNRDALRSHIRYVHEAERLHKCSVCEKAFKKPLELREHMASHTGGILYVCPYCPKTFNSNANMHSHRKKIHPNEWAMDKEKRYGPTIDV